MTEPKVSIIVPVYNVERYLERCIDSLRNQTLTDLEIILVDDASADGSPALCDKAAAEDSRIKVIHKENQGAGMARNAALSLATGEYIGFVDSDDYVAPEMYETLYRIAKKYESDLVMSGVLYVDGTMFGKEGTCDRKTYFERDTQFVTKEDIRKIKLGIVGAKPEVEDDSQYGMSIWKNLFRHKVIQENNLVFQSEREMLSEDALFMIDFLSCCNKVTGINQAFYHYCRNEESISKSYKKDRFEKSLVFVHEVEKRFQDDCSLEEYQVYIDRFWQAMCRVVSSQEILYGKDHNISYPVVKRKLKAVCTHPLTVRALRSYPIGKLPMKQRIFAYGMKYRMYFLLKILVGLRSK